MIKNTPSSFEYRFHAHTTRDARIRDETFSMPDYDVGHGRVNSSPEEKGLPRDPAVSDILPGIVAQVKREVGSPFLYYSRWITRPLSHSLQFKYNEPHTDTFLLILFPGLRTHPHLPNPSFASSSPPMWCNPTQSRHFSPLLERTVAMAGK